MLLQHVAQVTATDESSPLLGARPLDTQWPAGSNSPPQFPDPIGRELYRGPGTDVGQVLAAATPPPKVGVAMLVVEPCELVLRCRTGQAAVALARALTVHGAGKLDASMKECPAGGFPLCVVKAPAAAAQLRLTIPVAAFGKWLVTPEFLRFALAAAADQIAQEEATLVVAAASLHAVMPSVVAQHMLRRAGAPSPLAKAAPSHGRGGRRGGSATQPQGGRTSSRKVTASVSEKSFSTAKRTSTSRTPTPREERMLQAQAAKDVCSDEYDDPTLLSFGSAADERQLSSLQQQPRAPMEAWSPNSAQLQPEQKRTVAVPVQTPSGGSAGMRESALMLKSPVRDSREHTPSTTGDAAAHPSEPAARPGSMRGHAIDDAEIVGAAGGSVPMAVGAYQQPPAVGFDAQFRPAGFEQSVLESLQKAADSLHSDTDTVAHGRRDAGAQSHFSSALYSTTGSSLPLPHRAVLADNDRDAALSAPARLSEPESGREPGTTDGREDPFLVASPLSSDEESPTTSVATASGAATAQEMATMETFAIAHRSASVASPEDSYESRTVSAAAAATTLNSPGSMMVGLKLLDHSPVRSQTSALFFSTNLTCCCVLVMIVGIGYAYQLTRHDRECYFRHCSSWCRCGSSCCHWAWGWSLSVYDGRELQLVSRTLPSSTLMVPQLLTQGAFLCRSTSQRSAPSSATSRRRRRSGPTPGGAAEGDLHAKTSFMREAAVPQEGKRSLRSGEASIGKEGTRYPLHFNSETVLLA